MSDENPKRNETLKKLVTVEALMSALDPPMDAIVALEKRVEKMQLAQAELAGQVEVLTRALESSIERRAPVNQLNPRSRLVG